MSRIRVVRGEITRSKADAIGILNLKCDRLIPNNLFVDHIYEVGGKDIFIDFDKKYQDTEIYKYLKTLTTVSGQLPVEHIIHCMPLQQHKDDFNVIEVLEECYSSILQEAITKECKTIDLPAIISDIHQFPNEVAEIAYAAVKKKLESIQKLDVRFVCKTSVEFVVYDSIMRRDLNIPMPIYKNK